MSLPVRVAGTAMTPFGRHPDETVRSLATRVADDALADAGLAPGDVGLVVFANAVQGVLTGQEMIRGQAAFHGHPLRGTPLVNVENACASASTAFHVAATAIAGGAVDVAIAVGAEKLTHPDKRRTMSSFSCAVDLESMPALRREVEADLLHLVDGDGDRPLQSSLMELYAQTARRFFARGGADVADAAAVAVKNRSHAALNPRAQFRTPTTVEQVLGSRTIADPLRLLMCSPVADGAAAAVLVSEDRARTLARDLPRVLATALRGGHDPERDTAVRGAATTAYAAAGVGPGDLDLVEVHDATAPAELLAYEQLGLCAPGEAGRPGVERRHLALRAPPREPERRPALPWSPDRRDRTRPDRRADRAAPRPLRRPPGAGRPTGPRPEQRRPHRPRRGRGGGDDPAGRRRGPPLGAPGTTVRPGASRRPDRGRSSAGDPMATRPVDAPARRDELRRL